MLYWKSNTHADLIQKALSQLAAEKSLDSHMIIVDMEHLKDSEDQSVSIPYPRRLTIRELSIQSRVKYVSFVNSPEDRLRVLYSYLCWFQVKSKADYLIINGMAEYLSIIYSRILSKLGNDATKTGLTVDDFKTYSIGQVSLVWSKINELEAKEQVHVILNDPEDVVDRLDYIYMSKSKGDEVVNDFLKFKRENMVSLRELIGDTD